MVAKAPLKAKAKWGHLYGHGTASASQNQNCITVAARVSFIALLSSSLTALRAHLAYLANEQKLIERSLEVKLPTIWTDEKQRREESEKRREEERSKKRKPQKKEDPSARKGRQVAKHCVFPLICGSGCFSSDLWLRRVEK